MLCLAIQLKYAFIVILIYDILLSRWSWHFLACDSFFFQQNRVETSIRAFFSNPIATVFFCFDRRNCYEVSGTILSSVSAFCFMQFHVGCFEIPPDDARLVFATFLVNLKLLNCCIIETIYIEQITSLWSDSLVISACWLVLEQFLSTSFSHFVLI